jgi:hypothetical protein
MSFIPYPTIAGFYGALEHFAQYGKDYQRLLDCYRGTDGGRDEVLVQIRGAVGDLPGCACSFQFYIRLIQRKS